MYDPEGANGLILLFIPFLLSIISPKMTSAEITHPPLREGMMVPVFTFFTHCIWRTKSPFVFILLCRSSEDSQL